MNVRYINGNLLDTDASVIVHQVNCRGVLGNGLMSKVQSRHPDWYRDYLGYIRSHSLKEMVGDCLVYPIPDTGKCIISLFSQVNYGINPKVRYTSYDALDLALSKLRKWCIENDISVIAIPYMLACEEGNAAWNVVRGLLWTNFNDTKINIRVYTYIKPEQLSLAL